MSALALAEAGATLQILKVNRHEAALRDCREHRKSLGPGAKVLCQQCVFEALILDPEEVDIRGASRWKVVVTGAPDPAFRRKLHQPPPDVSRAVEHLDICLETHWVHEGLHPAGQKKWPAIITSAALACVKRPHVYL
jgi:hypothetical protein